MTFEDLKTIAAFGGFLLGLANLTITVYDKFLKRGTISGELGQAYAKLLDRGFYGFQFDLSLVSLKTANWIKDICLVHRDSVIAVKDPQTGIDKIKNKLSLRKAVKQTSLDYLALDFENIINKVNEDFKYAINLKDLKLEEGERCSLTFIGELRTERLPDEQLDMPLSGWAIVVDYGHKQAVFPLKFIPHPTSPKTTAEIVKKPTGFSP
ncbi:hypothetical protein [Nostoc sp. 'Peltigera membranacea cyanobiont' N6]|uniref:hypothetical protein n=1 Tax=Nostoc sp. 'Peltigera membranacea cyanobiont' N6 TaxID=1261031 RepID=UPI000CF30815|nr:hypothetical protein [Nostoc sp. 'Peltigera membranacea cyanobiont' N6]AVH68553.1 hypothetical protein NPM_70012 [Nostoc sp. 'Peltigera membranacea cyanobiont' N6]